MRRVLALNTLLYAVFGVGAFVVAILVVTNVSDVPLAWAIPWLVIVPPASSLGVWLSGSARGPAFREPHHAAHVHPALR